MVWQKYRNMESGKDRVMWKVQLGLQVAFLLLANGLLLQNMRAKQKSSAASPRRGLCPNLGK